MRFSRRPSYGFREWIGGSEFPAEAGRYHIYVGNTCPWCHRAVLAVVLRRWAPAITFSYMDDSKFSFPPSPNVYPSKDEGPTVTFGPRCLTLVPIVQQSVRTRLRYPRVTPLGYGTPWQWVPIYPAYGDRLRRSWLTYPILIVCLRW